MGAPESEGTGAPDGVDVVVESDPVRAGSTVRAHLDAGRRAAGFVGDPDDPAVAQFVADVLRPGSGTTDR